MVVVGVGGGGGVILFGAASGMSVLWRTIFIVYDCSDYFRACKDPPPWVMFPRLLLHHPAAINSDS